jgi:hypothetical protein
LYFIDVYDSAGTLQFSVEGWPPNLGSGNNPSDLFEGTENVISNPQFVEILFDVDPATDTFTYNVTGNESVEIAPDWFIETSGTGTVTLERVAVQETDVPSQPPYALQISSTGVTSIKLRQRITSSPRIFYSSFVSGYFLARGVGATLTVACSMDYTDSQGNVYPIIGQSNTDSAGAFTEFTGTEQILNDPPTPNTDTAPDGYVDFNIVFQPLVTVQITSVQAVEVQNESSSTQFLQLSVPRQEDYLFHYYKPQLINKPIPSYLVGWDFPLNPPQIVTGKQIAAKTGLMKTRFEPQQLVRL